MSLINKLMKFIDFKIHIADSFLSPLAFFAARLYVANVFWKSGMTKVANVEAATNLFKLEYIPNWEKNSLKHWLGMDIQFPVPNPECAAKMAILGETTLPVLLVIGLGGRFAAAGLFIMTMTINLFVYPGLPENHYWMLLTALVATSGPGAISIDHFIRKLYKAKN